MGLLNKLTVKAKVILIVALSTLMILFFLGKDIINYIDYKDKKQKLSELIMLSKSLSLLIHETQKERGASAGYLGSKGKKFKTVLQKQRLLTNKKITNYKDTLSKIDITLYPTTFQKEI